MWFQKYQMETNNLASEREKKKGAGWELHYLVPNKDHRMIEPAHAYKTIVHKLGESNLASVSQSVTPLVHIGNMLRSL